ncbi:MAG: glycine cleavage system protein R [Aquificaceae bacterium]
MKFFILSLFGKDRPGIVASVSKTLYELGLNIEDSSMTRLGDEFTIMLILSSEESITKEDILERLRDVEVRYGLFASCKELEASHQRIHAERNIYRIVVFGSDKPGIVYSVSSLLADKGINISNLRTEKRQNLYVMLIEAETEKDMYEELKRELEKLKESLKVDISIEREEEVEL